MTTSNHAITSSIAIPRTPAISRIVAVVAPLAAGVVAFAIVRPTLLPGLGFWDTGEFQTVGPVLGTAHPPGFPAYVVLGWLASVVLVPFGEPAFRMNLLSALLIASTAGVTVVLVRLLTGWTAIGIAAGIGLAASPLPWRLATHADPHALHVLLVALIFAALVAWERDRQTSHRERWLYVAAVLFGVSLANHTLTLLLAPGIALFLAAVDRRVLGRPRLVATCAVLVVATAALLYLELPLRAGPFRAPLVYARPDTLDGFLYVVLGQQFVGSFGDPFGNLGAKTVALVDVVATQFGPLALLVPIAFVVTAFRVPRYTLLTAPAALLTCLFAASYVNADIERYYLGPLLIAWTWIAVLAGRAVDIVRDGVLERWRDRAHFGSALRRAIPVATAVALGALLLAPTAIAVQPRSDRLDESQDRDAQKWVDDVLAALPANAVVISWWSYSTPLWYVQRVQHQRPDIVIIDDRTRLDEHLGEVNDVIAAHLGRQPVYVVRREGVEMDLIRARFQVVLLPGISGTLFVVTGSSPNP